MDAFDHPDGLRAETRKCEKHGPYPVRTKTVRGHKFISGSCPACVTERDREVKRAELADARSSLETRLARSAIPRKLRSCSFDTYIATLPEQQHALRSCRAFAGDFERERANGGVLILGGNTGTGKSHLAASIALSVIAQGATAMFATVQEIILMLRAGWQRRNGPSELEVLRMLTRVDLLIIDEAGVQIGSDAERNQLHAVIDGRYREERPMVLTANLSAPELLDVMGERIYSRLREQGQWVPFDWEDWRARRPPPPAPAFQLSP
ncbi:MAG: ATP-binding protein [Burkholderiales bacterium]|nr:ATP-binding protein [Burkholderiales bacterium]